MLLQAQMLFKLQCKRFELCGYSNAGMKVYRYLRLHIKIIRRSRFIFEIHAPEIIEMFVSKHTETIEYVKKYLDYLL